MTMKKVALTTKIKLTQAASSALENQTPSDNRLVDVLNGNSLNSDATRQLQRWMAAQILGNMGYKLEA